MEKRATALKISAVAFCIKNKTLAQKNERFMVKLKYV